MIPKTRFRLPSGRYSSFGRKRQVAAVVAPHTMTTMRTAATRERDTSPA